jgi:hypothetical protein
MHQGGGGGKGEQDEGMASPATPPHRQSQQQPQPQGRGRAAFAAAGGGAGGGETAGATSSDGRRGSSPRAGKAFSPSSPSSSKDRSGGVDRDDPAEAPARGLPCDVLWQKGPMLGKGAFGTVRTPGIRRRRHRKFHIYLLLLHVLPSSSSCSSLVLNTLLVVYHVCRVVCRVV